MDLNQRRPGDAWPPRSIRDLLDLLPVRPLVRITTRWGAHAEVRTTSFLCVMGSSLFRSDGGFLLLDCRATPEVEAFETGVAFDSTGFTVARFGGTVRVDYLDQP